VAQVDKSLPYATFTSSVILHVSRRYANQLQAPPLPSALAQTRRCRYLFLARHRANPHDVQVYESLAQPHPQPPRCVNLILKPHRLDYLLNPRVGHCSSTSVSSCRRVNVNLTVCFSSSSIVHIVETQHRYGGSMFFVGRLPRKQLPLFSKSTILLLRHFV
jgi:hypothetical protein